MKRFLATANAPTEIDPSTELERLGEKGLEVCEAKIVACRELGLGKDAIVLASMQQDAQLTGIELRQRLGLPAIYRSKYIQAVGNWPPPVEKLECFAKKILSKLGVADPWNREVLMVAHQPLADLIQPGIEDGVAVVPRHWRNRTFSRDVEYMASGSEEGLKRWLI